jgi:uncharacterized protein (TIGR04255 family)
MPFPHSQRVIYAHNPLDQVVCQLRFPPILKIDVGLPAEFQERVRSEFPSFSEQSEWSMPIPADPNNPIPPEILRQMVQVAGNRNFQFVSADAGWKLNLTHSFLALTADNYRRWERFREFLDLAISAFAEVYQPASFSRIGLRYINTIRRTTLGLTDIPWSSLLRPELLGSLAAAGLVPHVQHFESAHDFLLENGRGHVRCVARTVVHKESGEQCFQIDSDFSDTGRIAPAEVYGLLDYFNQRAGRLLRWAITERLHKAMEPDAI